MNKSKEELEIKEGCVHIRLCRNNAKFTLTDMSGNTIYSTSGGKVGYKNSRKSNWTSIRDTAKDLAKKASILGYRNLTLLYKNYATNQKGYIRVFNWYKCRIVRHIYHSQHAYNGCRQSRRKKK